MTVDVKRLLYFVAVAEKGSLTRAAVRLDIQHSQLSRQINSLERELHMRLFRRTPRGVAMTAAGRVLLNGARLTLKQLERALEDARRAARGKHGRLTVGIAPIAPFHSLVRHTIQVYRHAYPNVSVSVWEGVSGDIAARFAKDEMAIAFVPTATFGAASLKVIPLLEEAFIVALPSKHALAQRDRDKSVFLAELAGEPFILIESRGTDFQEFANAACINAGFTPRWGRPAPDLPSTLDLVARGMGVALLPVLATESARDGIIFRRVSGVQPNALFRLGNASWRDLASVSQFHRNCEDGGHTEGKKSDTS